DDDHRRGRPLLGAAGRALRSDLFRDELSARAPCGPPRGAPGSGGRGARGGACDMIVRVQGLEKAHGARQVLRGIDAQVARCAARPMQLSGGQQQRVAIARALAMEPEELLLDEPTSALDPEMRGEVLSVLRDLAGTTTMLVVTHEMWFARNAASRIWVFDEGRLIEDGPPSQVTENPRTDRARAFFRAVKERARSREAGVERR